MPDPFLDALGVPDPTAPAAPPKVSGASPFYSDALDAAVRTVAAEGSGDPSEAQWIAGVIRNRTNGGKRPILDVLQEPHAFEAWNTDEGRKRMAALDPKSPEYRKLADAVGPILLGQAEDPSGGATHFYAPEAQKLLAAKDGRPVKPDFDDGQGVQMGKTLFFGGAKGDVDPFLHAIGVTKPPGDPEDVLGAKVVPYKGLKQSLNPEQTAFIQTYQKGGLYDPKAQEGSEHNPFYMQAGATEADVPPGAYFVDRDGKLQRGADVAGKSSFLSGLSQGAGDVMSTLANAAPGAENSELANRFRADQMLYGAQYGGDLKSGLGRFTGQVAASAPLLAGAEAAIAPIAARTGVGAFMLGRGGATAAGAGPLALRGLSLATRGSLEGAGATGLVSSANPDESAPEQMLKGAAGGAVLGPVIPAVTGAGRWAGGALRSLAEPLTFGGREAMADRIIGKFAGGEPLAPDINPYVPGSQPTLATATGNAGVAQLERTLRLDPRVGPRFASLDDANAQARADFLANARGDRQTVADLVSDRNSLLDRARAGAFKDAQPVKGEELAKVIDEALASPESHMEEVARPLQQLRDKLVKPPPETSPAELAKFNADVAATFGGDGKALTPEVMQAAREKLGAKFEDIAGRTNIVVDKPLVDGLKSVLTDASQVLEEGKQKPLQNLSDQIMSTVQSGRISGASYKALIRKGGPLDVLSQSSDGAMRHYAGQMRETLDDALERTMSSDFPGDRIPLARSDQAAPDYAPKQDLTDQALNLLRDRKAGSSGQGKSLADALIAAGGLKDEGGELGQMDLRQSYGKKGGLLARKGGMSLDRAAEWAQANGYIGRDINSGEQVSQQELLDALRADLDGKRVFAKAPEPSDDVKNHAAELEEMLHEIGMDPGKEPNGRIKQRMAEYFGTSNLEAPGSAPAAKGSEGPAEPSSPEDVARGRAAVDELRQVRLQYKNLKTAEAALRTAGPDKQVSPSAVLSAVKRNFGNYAYKGGGPLGDVAESAVKSEQTRGPVVESDPKQVFGMRSSVDAAIAKLEKQGTDSANIAAARLKVVRDAMDQHLEAAAPGYAGYQEVVRKSAEAPEAMQYLQNLNVTDMKGHVTLGKLDAAMKRIESDRAKPGQNPAKAVSDATLQQLEALRADLLRQENLKNGKTAGSDTMQHVATGNVAEQFGTPLAVGGSVAAAFLHHPLTAAALGGAKLFYNAKSKDVMDQLATKLLTAEPPVRVTAAPRKAGPVRRVIDTTMSPILPVAGGILANRFVQ